MKKALLFLFLIYFISPGFSQKETSNVFIGLNLGYAWHTSDVKNTIRPFPWGAGFTLGGSFQRDYGYFFSYDLQFRYLGGNWYGKDTDTTTAINNNFAVNEQYSTLGYTVQNFKSTQHILALEAAIHFNRLRINTGLDIYLFLGLGVDFTQTKGDLLRKKGMFFEGSPYAYDSIPNGSIIDNDFESLLDKNSAGDPYTNFTAKFHPSVGFGIGYYFSPSFSMGFEHRTTFFSNDYFDGTIVNQNGNASSYRYDLFHYTSIYFKWYLRFGNRSHVNNTEHKDPTPTHHQERPDNRKPVDEKPTDDRRPTDDRTSFQDKKTPPTVQFKQPAVSPIRTTSPHYVLQANVEHIDDKAGLTFTHNGYVNNQFEYNWVFGEFEAKVELNYGENVFQLTGVNEDGKDQDQTVIIYERKQPKRVPSTPPTVNIVQPASSLTNVLSENYTVKTKITNVPSKNNLKVTLNGNSITNYDYDPTSKEVNFSSTIKLKEGENQIKIYGSNSSGEDSDQATIIYRKLGKSIGVPPVVNITDPNGSSYQTTHSSKLIKASLKHIKNRNQIQVKVNGIERNDYNFSSSTTVLTINVTLRSGTNTIQVIGTNPHGTDSDNTQIIYRKPVPQVKPPTVTITTPGSNPETVTRPEAKIVAKTTEITNSNQIKVTVNNKSFTQFNYNNSTKLIEFKIQVKPGANTVQVQVENTKGQAVDKTEILFRRAPSRPDGTGEENDYDGDLDSGTTKDDDKDDNKTKVKEYNFGDLKIEQDDKDDRPENKDKPTYRSPAKHLEIETPTPPSRPNNRNGRDGRRR